MNSAATTCAKKDATSRLGDVLSTEIIVEHVARARFLEISMPSKGPRARGTSLERISPLRPM